MGRTWIWGGVAAVLCLGPGAAIPAPAEPTKYCGDRIAEAEGTVKEIEAALGRVKDARDKGDIQAWLTQAKTHITAAKVAAQEEDCVQRVELAKTLTQDALLLAAQTQ
jgi:hypothetical protein